jgi:hypothetical protein
MATAIVFVAAFAFFALFRFYGFQVEDEGTLLFQLSRVAAGQFPYVDFHTGYTPGFFYVGAALLHALGTTTETLRPLLAFMNAASIAGLYALARRVVGPFMALVPGLAWIASLPLFREFAAFNVPYPAWFATVAWVAFALAMAGWVERGRHVRLVLAGVAAAFAFSVKPNAGAFALAAGVWIVALAGRRAAAVDRVMGPLASVVMLGGVWLAFGLQWRTVDAAVHLAPVAVVACVAAFALPGRLATSLQPRTSTALVALAAGFVPPTLVWVVPVLGRLGLAGFARDVLLLGSPAAALYYLAHPPPQLYALGIVVAVLGGALVGRAIARGWVSLALPVFGGAVLAVAVALHFARGALMPEGLENAIGAQVQNAGYWLAPLAHWGGIVLLLRARRAGTLAEDARVLLALVPLAVTMYLQLYPRTDDFHLVIAAPMSAVLATALLARVVAWWARAPRIAMVPTRIALHGVVAAVVLTVAMVRLGPPIQAWSLSRVSSMLVDGPRVRVRVDPTVADDLAAFDRTVNFLRSHTTPGEAALAFPALTGVLFAAGLTSPVPHDYWYPGRPDHDDEAAMVASLRAAPPRFVVTLNDGWSFFFESAPYFTAARAFAVEQYRLVARFGRFDVLARRDLAAAIPVERFAPTGPGADVIQPDPDRRRQAVRRWMAGFTVDEATHPHLDEDLRAAVLRLRALRDGGDLRAAGWLLAGYDHPHPRIREEALGAMWVIARNFPATRARWANDFDPAAWRPFVAPYFERAEALLTAPEDRARDFANALLELR